MGAWNFSVKGRSASLGPRCRCVILPTRRRIMPKRPIAIDILGGKTILCADKFGDVYSLPLLPSPEDATQIKEGVAVKSASSKPAAGSLAAAAASETFRPEANELTVHSRRNLRALESQKFEAERRQRQMQKQKQEREQQQQRTASADSATLLLGHVSMLTSIAIVTLRDDETKRHRTYIATSDRDSHIRLSRPPPQSYVCEAFLLTHEAFVSRLAAVRVPSVAEGGNGVRQVLVSGAGEATLQVWNSVRLSDSKSWAAQQLDFGELLQDRKTVAVNGLFPVAIPSTDNAAVSDAGLFVTFEG